MERANINSNTHVLSVSISQFGAAIYKVLEKMSDQNSVLEPVHITVGDIDPWPLPLKRKNTLFSVTARSYGTLGLSFCYDQDVVKQRPPWPPPIPIQFVGRNGLNLAFGKNVLQIFQWEACSPCSAVFFSSSVALQFKLQVMVGFYAIIIAEFMFRLQGPLQPSASFVVTETRNMTFTKSLQASDPDHSEVLQCLALWVQQQMLSVVSFASIIMHQQLLTLWDPGGDPYLLYRYKSLGGLLTLDMIYIVSMLVYIWLLTVHSCLLSMPDVEIQVKEKLCPCLTLIYRMLIFLLSPPAKAKQQDINTDTSVSARLATLKGILEFTETSHSYFECSIHSRLLNSC
jgi:hypothetical protein